MNFFKFVVFGFKFVVFGSVCWLALSACTPRVYSLARPAAGYDALKFRRSLVINPGAMAPNVEIPPGTMLVGNRITTTGDGVYCGPMVEERSLTVRQYCVLYRNGILVFINGFGEEVAHVVAEPDLVDHLKI
ncbi:MAG: hypothetical protein J0H14_17215 [Alphaproteobacteria bacterium]|nr:hypothetical protein [Alphaproteobacteria bacterium]